VPAWQLGKARKTATDLAPQTFARYAEAELQPVMETVPHFVPFFSVFSFRSVNGTERFRFLGKGTE
jgi:hypothetical protein